MKEYFNRQIQLWGEERQNTLQLKHVVIIGCGGLGCSLGIMLGSSGIGKITLVDFDEVSIHNIHRQIGFKIEDEGNKKSFVLKNLLESRCPYIQVNAIDGDFEKFSRLKIDGIDLILDATDNLPTRDLIDKFSKKNKIPWIYGSVEEFHGQVCFFEKANFNKSFQVIQRKPNGIAGPIVVNIASMQANLALRYLAGLEVKKDILNYFYYSKDGDIELKKFFLS